MPSPTLTEADREVAKRAPGPRYYVIARGRHPFYLTRMWSVMDRDTGCEVATTDSSELTAQLHAAQLNADLAKATGES